MEHDTIFKGEFAMKLTTQALRLKRTALLLAASLSPLFAVALEVPVSVTQQKALQASLNSTVRASVDEVARQATLIRAAHTQLNLELAAGNTRAAKATQASLEAHQAAFMKAQQNVRASLLQLQGAQVKTPTRMN
jgi:hypothetical protein